MPPVWELARRSEEHVKGMVMPGTLFEEFGFNYIGPIDGHDLDALIADAEQHARAAAGRSSCTSSRARARATSSAEADPVAYHGPGKFDPAVGIVKAATRGQATYTQVFGDWLCDMAAADPRLVGITPAMREGSGMVRVRAALPGALFRRRHRRAACGDASPPAWPARACKPVVAIYSTFLQRAYDQLIHDVALQNLPVLFALDRAGLVGADGATHDGAFDLTYLRCIPNMVVMAPADENECRQMLYTGVRLDHPAAVRYPRGAGPGARSSRP